MSSTQELIAARRAHRGDIAEGHLPHRVRAVILDPPLKWQGEVVGLL